MVSLAAVAVSFCKQRWLRGDLGPVSRRQVVHPLECVIILRPDAAGEQPKGRSSVEKAHRQENLNGLIIYATRIEHRD